MATRPVTTAMLLLYVYNIMMKEECSRLLKLLDAIIFWMSYILLKVCGIKRLHFKKSPFEKKTFPLTLRIV